MSLRKNKKYLQMLKLSTASHPWTSHVFLFLTYLNRFSFWCLFHLDPHKDLIYTQINFRVINLSNIMFFLYCSFCGLPLTPYWPIKVCICNDEKACYSLLFVYISHLFLAIHCNRSPTPTPQNEMKWKNNRSWIRLRSSSSRDYVILVAQNLIYNIITVSELLLPRRGQYEIQVLFLFLCYFACVCLGGGVLLFRKFWNVNGYTTTSLNWEGLQSLLLLFVDLLWRTVHEIMLTEWVCIFNVAGWFCCQCFLGFQVRQIDLLMDFP